MHSESIPVIERDKNYREKWYIKETDGLNSWKILPYYAKYNDDGELVRVIFSQRFMLPLKAFQLQNKLTYLQEQDT